MYFICLHKQGWFYLPLEPLIELNVFYASLCSRQGNTHLNNPSSINNSHSCVWEWQTHATVRAWMLMAVTAFVFFMARPVQHAPPTSLWNFTSCCHWKSTIWKGPLVSFFRFLLGFNRGFYIFFFLSMIHLFEIIVLICCTKNLFIYIYIYIYMNTQTYCKRSIFFISFNCFLSSYLLFQFLFHWSFIFFSVSSPSIIVLFLLSVPFFFILFSLSLIFFLIYFKMWSNTMVINTESRNEQTKCLLKLLVFTLWQCTLFRPKSIYPCTLYHRYC